MKAYVWSATMILVFAMSTTVHSQESPTGCGPDPLNPFAQLCSSTITNGLKNGEIRQGPLPGGRRGAPDSIENPGTSALPGRFGGKLVEPITQPIEKKIEKRLPGFKYGKRIYDALDPSPGDVLCLPAYGTPETAPFYEPCADAVDASWPDSISTRQGIVPPTGSKANRSDAIEKTLKSGGCLYPNFQQPLPSRANPACMTREQLLDEQNSLNKDFDRDAQEQRESWKMPAEDMRFLDDSIVQVESVLNDPSLTPQQRSFVQQMLSIAKSSRQRMFDNGLRPAPAQWPVSRPPYAGSFTRPAAPQPTPQPSSPYSGASQPSCYSCGSQ